MAEWHVDGQVARAGPAPANWPQRFKAWLDSIDGPTTNTPEDMLLQAKIMEIRDRSNEDRLHSDRREGLEWLTATRNKWHHVKKRGVDYAPVQEAWEQPHAPAYPVS